MRGLSINQVLGLTEEAASGAPEAANGGERTAVTDRTSGAKEAQQQPCRSCGARRRVSRRRREPLMITQRKSSNGSDKRQLDTLRSLGLRRINHTVVRDDSPQVRGMVHKVRHLVEVAENGNG